MTRDYLRDACLLDTCPLLHFIDTRTGEVLDLPGQPTCDVNGVDFIGEDDAGAWWGTERAAWMLSTTEGRCLVEVSGFLGSVEWQGFFIGTVEEALLWAEKRWIRIVQHEVLWSNRSE